ncbi:ketopantoate reductase family protein [Nocardioides psychrotolerans]|nr:2-dehydropantoate 2-reductase N-terminal domain-containing protein [Nocardioides psychrotolerans]
MRHVIYGAGAVGGVIGANLHLGGVPVTLVARGEHLARIRTDGLVLDRHDGRHVVRAAAVDSAAAVDWAPHTVVLLCVKSHQTDAALDDLVAHAPPDVPVVCVQNGVANERTVLRRFPATYSVCVMLPSTHLEPGVVVQHSRGAPGILDIGRVPGGVDDVTEAVSADLHRGGFASVPRPDIAAWKHRKLLVNTVGDVRALCGPAPERDVLAARVLAEGEAVLSAARIPVVTRAQDDERRGDLLRDRTDADLLHRGNSLWQSLSRGLDSEIDYRAGEIVLLGRLHDVPTPANEAMLRAARDLAGSDSPPHPLDAAALLASPSG